MDVLERVNQIHHALVERKEMSEQELMAYAEELQELESRLVQEMKVH